MKKKLLIILLSISFSYVSAKNDFRINVDNIEIHSKSQELLNNLDQSYKIEIKDFVSTETVNQEAKDYTKKIIKILFDEQYKNNRSKLLFNEQFKSNVNGFDTLSAFTFIKMFLEEFNKLNVSYDYIKLIRTIEFEQGVITLTYMPNANVNGSIQDYILVLYLKEDTDGYKLFIPWQTSGDNLEEYFNNLGDKEKEGEVIGGTYKSLSLNGNSSKISDETIKLIYDINKNSNVSISALREGDTNSYGSGFFIREGIVVTTWSLLLDMLNNSEFIYITDRDSNTYNIDGIVAADPLYDVVLLKIDKEIGKPVTFSENILNIDDYLFLIDSRDTKNYSIRYGTNISYISGKYKNMLALESSDVGGAIYNIEGDVIGFNTNNSLNSDVSIANSTNYLIDIQNVLNNKEYEEIDSTSFLEFKDKYYHSYEDEIEYNKVPKRIWNKYKKELDTIKSLKLVKASYVDNIVSLRYKNEVGSSLNSFYFIDTYTKELVNNGYSLSYQDNDRQIYSYNNKRIIIKQSLDYLIIIIMEK